MSIAYIFYLPLVKVISSFFTENKYHSLRSKNPNMLEQELLINTIKSRQLFRRLCKISTMALVGKESIKGLEDIVVYIIKEERTYQKGVFLNGRCLKGPQ